MASKIVPGNIDGTYPKAGQDNSSQGFRDNFNEIKTNFTEAKSEIEDLQTNKANHNASSDFTNNELTRAKLKNKQETVYAHGTTGGSITLNQKRTVSDVAILPATDADQIAFPRFDRHLKIGREVRTSIAIAIAGDLLLVVAVAPIDHYVGIEVDDVAGAHGQLTGAGRVVGEPHIGEHLPEVAA